VFLGLAALLMLLVVLAAVALVLVGVGLDVLHVIAPPPSIPTK
jgi:hypothetical protein